jgi:hypothetical protein
VVGTKNGRNIIVKGGVEVYQDNPTEVVSGQVLSTAGGNAGYNAHAGNYGDYEFDQAGSVDLASAKLAVQNGLAPINQAAKDLAASMKETAPDVVKSNKQISDSFGDTAKTSQVAITKGNLGILDSHAATAAAALAHVQGMSSGVTGTMAGMGSNITSAFDQVASSVEAALTNLKGAAASCSGGLCGSTATPLASALSEVASPSAAGGYAASTPSRLTPLQNVGNVTIQSAVFQKEVDVSRFLKTANDTTKRLMTQAGLS